MAELFVVIRHASGSESATARRGESVLWRISYLTLRELSVIGYLVIGARRSAVCRLLVMTYKLHECRCSLDRGRWTTDYWLL